MKFIFYYAPWHLLSTRLVKYITDNNIPCELFNVEEDRKKSREAGIREIPVLRIYTPSSILLEEVSDFNMKNYEKLINEVTVKYGIR